MKTVHISAAPKGSRSRYVTFGDDVLSDTLYVGKPVDLEDEVAAHVEEIATALGFKVEVGDPEVEPSEAQKYANAHDGPTLKAEAESLGLPTSGSKGDLAQRILDHKAATGAGDGA